MVLGGLSQGTNFNSSLGSNNFWKDKKLIYLEKGLSKKLSNVQDGASCLHQLSGHLDASAEGKESSEERVHW